MVISSLLGSESRLPMVHVVLHFRCCVANPISKAAFDSRCSVCSMVYSNLLNDSTFCRNYWRDSDTALFMLKHLYRDIPEDSYSSCEPLEGSSKDDRSTVSWYDQREEADEEFPLTFADKVTVKSFSHRARKTLKW